LPLAALLFATTSLPSGARADVGPDPDYVESCSLEQQRREGDDCFECRASFQDRDACKRHAEGGYAPRCQTRGASVWTEIWCRVKPSSERRDDFAQPPPGKDEPIELASADDSAKGVQAPEKHGCGACAVGAPSSVPTGLLAAMTSAMALALRRRRRG
jgi:MYXO-CTERM domain-containing protein